ncbi:hypothetical protein OUZ56_023919 [Daphnia magna]|uniref:Uncharacterized protein n=1 Tax=Daphnia magna TaxID=35525 RepID=A0ABR0AZW1_9CRUS|nr:hypothetical protein OUZ56_023919 [Daphnia magna]
MNLKSYEEACRDNLLDNAEVANELTRDRTKRLIKQYEVIILQLDAENQTTYIDKHEDSLDRHHQMVIDWRNRRPTVRRQIEDDPANQSDDEEENNSTTSRDAAQAATGVAQVTTQAVNTIALKPQQNIMSIAHLLPRIEFAKFEVDSHKWKDWWAIFRTLIPDNPSLRPIENFSRSPKNWGTTLEGTEL